MSIQLGCPCCSHILQEGESELICPNCHERWPVVDGIPRFVTESYYWSEVPLEIMQAVNRRSEVEGWHQPVKDLLAEDYSDIYNYVTDTRRADFCQHIPLTPRSVVADIGSGWGTISCLLAARCGRVLSVESVTERIKFLKIRALEEKLDNLLPVQADFLELPLAESSLDLAVMNGVLEWIGIASEDGRPDELQLKVLRKIHSSLKPGGTLYIGIENRYAFHYFFGVLDHSDLPFTSLVPRQVADLMMRRKGQASRRTTQAQGSYRTYTYSYWGYHNLLNKAGFSQTDIYLVLPDYNRPYYIVRPEDTSAFLSAIRNVYADPSLRTKIIKSLATISAPFGLQRFFSPMFSIYAKK